MRGGADPRVSDDRVYVAGHRRRDRRGDHIRGRGPRRGSAARNTVLATLVAMSRSAARRASGAETQVSRRLRRAIHRLRCVCQELGRLEGDALIAIAARRDATQPAFGSRPLRSD